MSHVHNCGSGPCIVDDLRAQLEAARKELDAGIEAANAAGLHMRVSEAIEYLDRELAAERDKLERWKAGFSEVEEALTSAYEFHKTTECISEGREECSCSAFNDVRDALAALAAEPTNVPVDGEK